MRKYRDQARTLAVKAAREKADLLAKELEVKVGPAHTVSEYSGGWWSGYSSWWGSGYYGAGGYQNVAQNAVSNSSSSDLEGTVALGQIRVNAAVSVSFELE